MDNYLIMILSPVVFLISKLSIHHKIINDILRKRHSETYMKKNKGNFIISFFMVNFKKELKWYWYYLNAFLGYLTILSIILAVIYLILMILNYELKLIVIPNIMVIMILILAISRLLRLMCEKLF